MLIGVVTCFGQPGISKGGTHQKWWVLFLLKSLMLLMM